MRAHELLNLNEGVRPPVIMQQVVTPQWISEILEHGFDVGLPHAGAEHQDGGFDYDSVDRMLTDLQDRGTIPSGVRLDDAAAVFPYMAGWLTLRYRHVIRGMKPVRVRGGYRIGRNLRLSRAGAEELALNDKPLGNFWSFSGGEAFWGDEALGSVFLDGIVARDQIDWITTIRRNMNYTLGEEEQEVFLPTGTPIHLVSLKMDDGRGGWTTLPLRNPNRKA